ncbi:MAG: DNA recombination protein RmuC [Candidatus Kapaibacteriota bacterium]
MSLPIAVAFIFGFVIGAGTLWVLVAKRLRTPASISDTLVADLRHMEDTINHLRTEVERERHEGKTLFGQLEARKQEVASLREQLEQQRNVEDVMQRAFRDIANEGLLQQGQRLSEQQQRALGEVLEPFRARLKEFQERVDANQQVAVQTNAELMERIRTLTDLNQAVSAEAQNLTRALKGDNKAAGTWGEVVLDRILEASGLTKELNYRTQHTTTNVDGVTIKPDVIVDLPDHKHIIIDSKLSLQAYERYSSLDDGAPGKEDALRAHVNSIKQHIAGLSEKHYHTGAGLNSPEFVLMFFPVEPTFSATIGNTDLYEYAWERHIVMVSPSTLLATLRTIASMWRIEHQNQNALDIAARAGKLYDKFVNFVADLEAIRAGVQKTEKSVDDAFNKLISGSGNLIGQVEKLKSLGAKAQKQLPRQLLLEGDGLEEENPTEPMM